MWNPGSNPNFIGMKNEMGSRHGDGEWHSWPHPVPVDIFGDRIIPSKSICGQISTLTTSWKTLFCNVFRVQLTCGCIVYHFKPTPNKKKNIKKTYFRTPQHFFLFETNKYLHVFLFDLKLYKRETNKSNLIVWSKVHKKRCFSLLLLHQPMRSQSCEDFSSMCESFLLDLNYLLTIHLL